MRSRLPYARAIGAKMSNSSSLLVSAFLKFGVPVLFVLPRHHHQWPKICNQSLAEVDPEIADIIEHEKARQWKGLELIPSENFTSSSVMEAVGSVMTNKYSEGYPGARYYGGNGKGTLMGNWG